MRARPLVLALLAWSCCLLVGAWAIRPITQRVDVVAALASYEAVHIVAHTFLYGTLTLLARRVGLRAVHAAAVALSVGALQEAVQVIQVGRAPGTGELFDLFVDGAAVAVALALATVRRAPRAEIVHAPISSP